MSLGDVDGDVDLDAWVANTNGQPNRVWLNEGGAQGGITGSFIDSGQALGNSGSYGVSLGDVDGDGDLDAWVANADSGIGQPNRVWLNAVPCPSQEANCNDGLDNDSDMLVDCEDPDCIGDVDCPQFRRGDCNRDGTVDIGDAVTLLAFLFPSGPVTPFDCEDACDGNDDETLDISDAIRLLTALFGGTVPLGAPYPDCGVDPTIGVLDCDQYSLCP